MRPRLLATVISISLKYVSILILIPIIVAIIDKDYASAVPFLCASLCALISGYLLNPKKTDVELLNSIKRTEGLFVVFFSWVAFALICMIPYLFYHLSPIDSLFESVSGITTTGSTIFKDFSLYPKALFFFRGMTQWFGGMGIIILFIAILPQFAVAGRQMFFAETPGPIQEKITPRIRNTATALWGVYVGLTFMEIILLKIAGLDWYDSFCNSFATMAGGGFSPNPLSIMGYNSSPVVWIITVFMFLSGVNFTLQYKAFVQRKFKSLIRNEEFSVYLAIVVFCSIALTCFLYFQNFYDITESVRHAFFQVVSIITTTGFGSADFIYWSVGAKLIIILVMLTGASAGAASGGIKIVRVVLIFKYLWREIQKLVHPQAVVPFKIDGVAVTQDIRRQVVSFVLFYFIWLGISSFITAAIENSMILGFTGSATTMGNIGPGFGKIGPMGSFGDLHFATKAIYIFNMLVGRLELVPFLVILNPDFWHFKKG